VLPDALERRGPVHLGRAPRGVAGNSVRLRLAHRVTDRMEAGVRVGELGPAVTGSARPVEDRLPAGGSGLVEAAGGWGRRSDGELVGLQRRQLAAHEIVRAVGDRHAGPRLGERAVPAHLGHGHVPVPIREVRAVAGDGDGVDVLQSVRRRDLLGSVLPVEVEPRVVPSGAPAVEDRLGRLVERRGERDDRPDVEVAVGPAVEALPDTVGERVVDRRVAKRAGDADPGERVGAVHGGHGGLDPDDGIELQQGQGGGRVGQADGAVLDPGDHRRRERLRIHLEPDRERGGGIDRADHLVHAQRVGPLRLVAEGVEPEDLLALGDELVIRRAVVRGAASDRPDHADEQRRHQAERRSTRTEGKSEVSSERRAHRVLLRRNVPGGKSAEVPRGDTSLCVSRAAWSCIG